MQPGVVTGFLGPNGADTCTTMRMVLGLDASTIGTIIPCCVSAFVSGHDITAARIGFSLSDSGVLRLVVGTYLVC